MTIVIVWSKVTKFGSFLKGLVSHYRICGDCNVMRGFSSLTVSFNNIQAVQFKLISQVCDVQWLWTYHLHYLSCPQLWTNLQKHLLSGWGHRCHHHFVVCPEFANKSSFFWHLCPPLWMIMLPQAIFVSKKIKINKLMLTSIFGTG